MSEIHLINSMNQSIINKIIEFKNKEIKKEELNKYMLLNLTHILKVTNKIKSKNEKMNKEQKIEINKTLSKIKLNNLNYNQKEIESRQIMKKLVNPTLELYIPVSEISYSTEIIFYNRNSDKCNFNESLLFKKQYKKESENEEKEYNFEEPPILFLKNSHIIKKLNNINKIL